MKKSLWNKLHRTSYNHQSFGHDSMDLQGKLCIQGGEPMHKIVVIAGSNTRSAVVIQRKNGQYVSRWVKKK